MSALPEHIESKFVRTDSCWIWTASIQTSERGGYGQVKVDGKTRKAHRVIYELLVGPIPEGLELDHLCRNRACVNPEHLEPVVTRVNILRGEGACATHARKTHCPRGHEYETAIWQGKAVRTCRVCSVEKARAWRRNH